MKKCFVCVAVLVFLAMMSTSLSAINFFVNVGYSVSDIKGVFFDAGAEIKVAGNFYAQFLFDYYFNPGGEEFTKTYGKIFDDSAYGFNLYGMFKFKTSEKLRLFVKGGVHYTTVRLQADFLGTVIALEDSDFGFGGGAGLEYSIAKKVALVLGATAKTASGEDVTTNWFKFYGGVNVRLN